ncbi:hypothetical protein JQ580_31410 [Bradyrhizobium japonicum]|uniref:phage fiber-tail adaptor protein n=1 Tax=Bradyrhizobium japonicum TaxID=375 RepID=UPI001BABE4B0|nr:hypothetical protein [Bradyrhizobium japonicum]MBR0995227.1 hypothetical protein [Bradyrhizobium japonicum]
MIAATVIRGELCHSDVLPSVQYFGNAKPARSNDCRSSRTLGGTLPSSGTEGETYLVQNRIVTTGGRTMDQTVKLKSQ